MEAIRQGVRWIEEEQKLEHAGKHMSGEYECSDDEPDVTDDFGDDKEESTRKKLANLLGVTLDEKPKETTIKDQMEATKWEDLHYTHQSRASNSTWQGGPT